MNGVQLLLVVLGALSVSVVAHRKGVQPGVLIVVLAAAVSFIPGLPRLQLDPDLILGVVVPPLLYSATLNFSLFAFLKNLRSIVGLGVGLVAVTTVLIGLLAAAISPVLALPSALVLASVISPPDTVTTVSHGRELGLPKRVVSILTGESLVNDAAALALFAVTVAAVTGTEAAFISNPVLLFGYEAVVGLIVGLLLGRLVSLIRRRTGDPTIESALGVIVPFAAYLAAEQLEASGVLAVVAAGFTVSMRTFHDTLARPDRPVRQPPAMAYRTRLQEAELWPVVDLVLEAFVFSYMGLQLRFVLSDLRASDSPTLPVLLLGVGVLVAIMGLRFGWVIVSYGRVRLALRWRSAFITNHPEKVAERAEQLEQRRARHRPDERPRERQMPDPLSWQESLLVAWTGMRGIITLAAAAGVPLTVASGAAFPGRTEIQVVAFVVALGSLVVQGATLPILARRLRIDTTAEDAEDAAMWQRAEALVTAARADGADFDGQRRALTAGLMERAIDPETVRSMITRIDLRQAAAQS